MPLVTVDKTYKYEVAFSFLQQDESLAYQINDLIQDRLSTFIYSQQQKELVGKDGIETFSSVFGEEARIVVVLYREGWGKTPWTRVEETAIQARSLDESIDFTVFASLDKKKPKWLTKTQIWYDIEHYGIKPLAAIIEKKVAEYGGQVREETFEDRTARYKRELDREAEVKRYLNSNEGYVDAIAEAVRMLELAERNIQNFQNTTRTNLVTNRNFQQRNKYLIITSQSFGLSMLWTQESSLINSYFSLFFADSNFYDANPNRRAIGKIIGSKVRYYFSLSQGNEKVWVDNKTNDWMTTEQLLTHWQKDLLEKVRLEYYAEQNQEED